MHVRDCPEASGRGHEEGAPRVTPPRPPLPIQGILSPHSSHSGSSTTLASAPTQHDALQESPEVESGFKTECETSLDADIDANLARLMGFKEPVVYA